MRCMAHEDGGYKSRLSAARMEGERCAEENPPRAVTQRERSRGKAGNASGRIPVPGKERRAHICNVAKKKRSRGKAGTYRGACPCRAKRGRRDGDDYRTAGMSPGTAAGQSPSSLPVRQLCLRAYARRRRSVDQAEQIR